MFAILLGILIIWSILWTLISKGIFWKIPVGIFAYIGIKVWILNNFPDSSHPGIIILDYPISLAASISFLITFLGLATVVYHE